METKKHIIPMTHDELKDIWYALTIAKIDAQREGYKAIAEAMGILKDKIYKELVKQ